MAFWAKWKLKIFMGVAVLAALIGAFFVGQKIGYTKGEAISKVEIAEYEKQVQSLRAELAKKQVQVDTKIVTEYVTKREVQTQVEYKNRDVIRTVVKDRPMEQSMPCGWIYAHDQVVQGLPVDPVLANDEKPCGIGDRKILDVVTVNYGIASRTAEQLKALQNWITETEKAREEVTGN